MTSGSIKFLLGVIERLGTAEVNASRFASRKQGVFHQNRIFILSLKTNLIVGILDFIMPRPPRIEYEGGLYHVTSRGNGRRAIFVDDSNRKHFLCQLEDNLATYQVILYAYVLMQNHYHILVRTTHANLSRFMQRLNTSYALYFRYKQNMVGHVLQGRYKARIVEGNEYMVAISRYIHLNPVKTDAAEVMTKTERVIMLEKYRWNSYQGYTSKDKAQDLVCYALLEHFGKRPTIARRRYRAYIHSMVTENDEPLLKAMQDSPYAIGSEDYQKEIWEDLQTRRTGRQSDRDVDLPRDSVNLCEIDSTVSDEFGLTPDDLTKHGHHGGLAKAVAMELACRLTTMNQRQIGMHYGKITSMAVCMARRKFRKHDGDTSKQHQDVLGRLEQKIRVTQN